MLNRKLAAEDATFYNWTNGGTAKVSGAVIAIGALLGVLQTDVAANATGSVQIGGVFEVTKQTADVMTQGQIVGFDIANQRADSAFLGNLEVWEAAGSGPTKVKVRFPNGSKPLTKAHSVSSAEDSANVVVLNSGYGVNPAGPVTITLSAVTTGVRRLPAGNCTWAAGVLTIADAGAAVNELIHISVQM